MSSLNKAMIIGNLGADPDIKTMQNGGKVANLSIATSESWKDKNTGERREKTEWHRVVVFNEGIVGVCERYLKKGSKVFIEGRIETRKWTDQNGNDRYSTEIVLKPYTGSLTMLGDGGAGNSSQGNAGASDRANSGNNSQSQQPATTNRNLYDDFEDDIPF